MACRLLFLPNTSRIKLHSISIACAQFVHSVQIAKCRDHLYYFVQRWLPMSQICVSFRFPSIAQGGSFPRPPGWASLSAISMFRSQRTCRFWLPRSILSTRRTAGRTHSSDLWDRCGTSTFSHTPRSRTTDARMPYTPAPRRACCPFPRRQLARGARVRACRGDDATCRQLARGARVRACRGDDAVMR